LSWLLAAKADIQFSSVQNELNDADKILNYNLNNINKSLILSFYNYLKLVQFKFKVDSILLTKME
jgi:hypothetical protein